MHFGVAADAGGGYLIGDRDNVAGLPQRQGVILIGARREIAGRPNQKLIPAAGGDCGRERHGPQDFGSRFIKHRGDGSARNVEGAGDRLGQGEAGELRCGGGVLGQKVDASRSAEGDIGVLVVGGQQRCGPLDEIHLTSLDALAEAAHLAAGLGEADGDHVGQVTADNGGKRVELKIAARGQARRHGDGEDFQVADSPGDRGDAVDEGFGRGHSGGDVKMVVVITVGLGVGDDQLAGGHIPAIAHEKAPAGLGFIDGETGRRGLEHHVGTVGDLGCGGVAGALHVAAILEADIRGQRRLHAAGPEHGQGDGSWCGGIEGVGEGENSGPTYGAAHGRLPGEAAAEDRQRARDDIGGVGGEGDD